MRGINTAITLDKETYMELKTLINNLEQAMENHWDAIANCEFRGTEENVFYAAQEIEALGIGGVLIPTMQGQLKWFSLEEMVF